MERRTIMFAAMVTMGTSYALVCGCSAASDPPASRTTGASGGGTSSSGSGGSTSSSGSGGGTSSSGSGGGTSSSGSGGSTTGPGTGGSTTVPLADAKPLPLIVDGDGMFATSGYMGDGETLGNLVMTPMNPTDTKDCGGDRSSATASGSCHKVTYTPPTPPGKGWAGIYWQHPANNWGTSPGLAIAAGAKKVSFYAKGKNGGEVVAFGAGGITGTTGGDTFKSEQKVTLTTSWAPYSVDLTSATYTQVMGGFYWAAGVPVGQTGSIVFLIDDIKWE